MTTICHTTAVFEVDSLEVKYESFQLGPLSFSLDDGQIVSLLGPNGAGKTTLLRSMLGLSALSGGAATLDGADLPGRDPHLLRIVGYLSDSADDVIPELTPEEYWEFCAAAYARYGGVIADMVDTGRRIAAALDLTVLDRRISTFSLGMRRKVQLAAALLHRPAFVVLDEPLVGLDFVSIRALERLLTTERERGALILMAAHDLGVVVRIADRALVVRDGQLILDAEIAPSSTAETIEELLGAALGPRERGGE
jgi:ABC-2 type transport system ATP-binding protein